METYMKADSRPRKGTEDTQDINNKEDKWAIIDIAMLFATALVVGCIIVQICLWGLMELVC